jgi:hypothetical protein
VAQESKRIALKVHACHQGSQEWLYLRAGIPCASQMHRIITPTGKASTQAETYKFELLAERILGRPLVEHISWAMDRGSALEKKAVQYFSFETDYKTEEVGFITDDLERWGCSPDRLVGEHSLLEVKAPEIAEHMQNLLQDGHAYKKHFIQVQSQMWIAERSEAWLLSYHPDLPWSLQRVNRDDKFIAILVPLVEKFCNELEQLSQYAKERGWFRKNSIREPKISAQDELIKAMKESLIATK